MSVTQSLEIGAAYIRVSTDDQTELSPDAQLRVILDAAKDDHFVIPQEYIFIEKKGISGRKADNRPEFQNMIAIAKSQQPAPFKRLYLWKFSRFARNQEESTFYKGILRKKCGVEIKSVSEPIMEGMFGRLIETIIEWFDEYYSINLSGEVIRGMSEKALRNGYQMVPSLGYDAVGGGKPFVINEEKYAIVEYIFQNYYAGKDMSSIARDCNNRGWRTRRGNPFERRTILRVLNNKFYIGQVYWNGYNFQGTHETRPSITDIFDECQERMSREYRPAKRRDVSNCKHWLSGLIKCSVCGATLAYQRTSNPKKRGNMFNCWKYLKGFHPGSSAISERHIEKSILESLKKVIDTNIIEFEYIPKVNNNQKNEISIINDALSRVDIKEQRIREAYENGIDTIDEYRTNKERLAKEREALTRELIHLQEQFSANDEAPDKKELIAKIESVYDIVSDCHMEYETKGIAIRSVIKEIVWDKTQKELHFHYYA